MRKNVDGELRGIYTRGKRDLAHKAVRHGERSTPLLVNYSIPQKLDRRVGEIARDTHRKRKVAANGFESKRCFCIGSLRYTEFANRIPGLNKGLGLPGSQVGKVRLIIRIHTSHQFDVWAVGIGQASIPGVSERVISPRPLLLSRGDVMIRDMHETGLRRVVVP